MVWRIWWMAGFSLLAIIAIVIITSFFPDPGYVITAEEMRKMENRKEKPGIVTDSHAPVPLVEQGIV
jgi:cytochrome o ubiquinol oxidase subunit 1